MIITEYKFIMKYENALIPSNKQMKEFKEGDIDTPIYMVNLLKFKKKQNMRTVERQNFQAKKLMQFMD
tara:strand:+ start:932 stop:1135 length:204 start_codon:yes stop_codon:yes gene_type:complete